MLQHLEHPFRRLDRLVAHRRAASKLKLAVSHIWKSPCDIGEPSRRALRCTARSNGRERYASGGPMDFELSEEHRMMKDLVARFVRDELMPLEARVLARE